MHVNNHWHDMDTTELETQNRLLESAMNLGANSFSDPDRTH